MATTARRAGWGIADQAASSLTNFALGLLVARQVPAVAFGAFSVAFVTYLLFLNLGRAVVAQPLLIRHSTGTTEAWHDGARSGLGAAAVLGVLGGAACVAAGLLMGGDMLAPFTAIGLALPFLLVQDTWRFAFFAAGRERDALVNDLVWVAVVVPAFGVVTLIGTTSVFPMVLVWGAGAAVASLVGIIQAGFVPDPRRSRGWFRTHADLVPRFSLEVAARMGAAQLSYYVIGLVSGLAAVGAIRAGDLLLGPFNILFQGIHLIALPEARRRLDNSIAALRSWCLLLSGVIGVGALGFGLVCLALPDSIGRVLLGSSWDPARSVLLPLVVALVGLVTSAGALVGLRALGAADRVLRAAVLASAVTLLAATGGALAGAAPGAAWGLAAGSWIGAVGWWVELRLAITKAVIPPGSVTKQGNREAVTSPDPHPSSNPFE